MIKNKYILTKSHGVGFASNGIPFYFDIEDFDKIKDYKWSINQNKWGNYVHARIDKKWTYLHRYLLNVKNRKNQVDHIDRNRLNNQKSNLRMADNQKNAYNQKIKKNNKTGVSGVVWSKRDQGYYVGIRTPNGRIYGGFYKNFHDAVVKRLTLEKKYHEEFSSQKHLYKKYGIE